MARERLEKETWHPQISIWRPSGRARPLEEDPASPDPPGLVAVKAFLFKGDLASPCPHLQAWGHGTPIKTITRSPFRGAVAGEGLQKETWHLLLRPLGSLAEEGLAKETLHPQVTGADSLKRRPDILLSPFKHLVAGAGLSKDT